MSMYIMLGKIPTSPEERKKLIGERISMEDHLSNRELTHVQKKVIEFLVSEKGYSNEDIEANREFSVELRGDPPSSFTVKADVVLNLDGRRFLVIKCVLNSPESWERHTSAFCRVADAYQIPFGVVTDSETAKLLDAAGGKPLSEGLASIPSREEALQLVKKTVFCAYPEEKCEKEKRILYAFDAITCHTETKST